MRRLILALVTLALGVCIFLPSTRYTEDEDTVLLARAIYALGKDESFETKLKLGSVVMNRVENAWFPDDLGEVLSEPQQFPAALRCGQPAGGPRADLRQARPGRRRAVLPGGGRQRALG